MTNRDKVGGTVQRLFQRLVDGRSPPGRTETQGQEGPRPAGSAVSSQRPPAWLETWAVASLCLLQTIGPGSPVGLTQRSVVSAPGWQGRPGQPRFGGTQVTPPARRNSSLSRLSHSHLCPGAAQRPQTPNSLARPRGILAWLGQANWGGKICQRLRRSGFSAWVPPPRPVLFFRNRVFQGLP